MRLIDADELKEGLEQHFKSTDEYELDGIDHAFNRGYNSGLERALFSIIHAKVVDAVEVRHGKWQSMNERNEIYGDVYMCDNCGHGFIICESFNYFPNCGAKMDAGDGE